MKNVKKSNKSTRSEGGSAVVQLSHAQSVIAACVLITFGLVCFMGGMLLKGWQSRDVTEIQIEKTASENGTVRLSVKDVNTEEQKKKQPVKQAPATKETWPKGKLTSAQREGKLLSPDPKTIITMKDVATKDPVQPVTLPEVPAVHDIPAPPGIRSKATRVDSSTVTAKKSLNKTQDTETPQIKREQGEMEAGSASTPVKSMPTESSSKPEASPAPVVLEKPAKSGTATFAVQVVACKLEINARKAGDILAENSEYHIEVVKRGGLFQVLVGNYSTRTEAAKVKNRLREKPNFADCFVVRTGE